MMVFHIRKLVSLHLWISSLHCMMMQREERKGMRRFTLTAWKLNALSSQTPISQNSTIAGLLVENVIQARIGIEQGVALVEIGCRTIAKRATHSIKTSLILIQECPTLDLKLEEVPDISKDQIQREIKNNLEKCSMIILKH